MSWLENIQRAYGELDENIMGGYLPGGAARNKNLTEAIISVAASDPKAQVLRSGMNAAGKLAPETFGPLSDAGENAIRAITGDRRDRNPSEYTSTTRDKLADAIDKALPDKTMIKDEDGFTQVDYSHYNKDGSNHKGPIAYVGGRVWGRKNDDGTYELRSDENYDFNAGVQRNNKEYKDNLNSSTMAALGRGDLIASVSSVPDHLAYHTGAGSKGFNIGGKFNRSEKESNPVVIVESSPEKIIIDPVTQPATAYAVKAGDTLSSIAAQRGATVAELVKRNNISNPNMISVGQLIR
jgi:hypothetical protein